jgi:hypothetical protein
MRRISAVLVALAMLAMCAASFGNYFLIYNVSTSMGGVDFVIDKKVSVPLKGYLVLDLNDSDVVQDANLVLYGKNVQTPRQLVYVQLNSLASSDSNYLDWDVQDSGTYIFFDFWAPYGETKPFYFEFLVMGKKAIKNVGPLAGSKSVAPSMKGSFMIWRGMLLDGTQDLEGTSNFSLTLNNSLTKGVNDTLPTWTQDQIINGQDIDGVTRGIIPDLVRKHYSNALP